MPQDALFCMWVLATVVVHACVRLYARVNAGVGVGVLRSELISFSCFQFVLLFVCMACGVCCLILLTTMAWGRYACSWPAYYAYKNITPNYTDIAEHCNLWRTYDDIQVR